MNKLLSHKPTICAFVLPAFILYSVFVIIPIGWAISYTFFSGVPGFNFEFTGIENYIRLFQDKKLLETFAVNGKYLLVMVSAELVIGFFVALFIQNRVKRYSSTIRSLLFLPVIIPAVACSALFQKIYELQPNYGLLNSLLEAVGLEKYIQAWLGQTSTAIWCAGIAGAWKSVGMYIAIFYTGLIAIPSDYIEAAKIDGAGGGRILRSIILPSIKPTLIIALVLSVTGALKVYDFILSLTGGGPGRATYVPLMYMYDLAFKYYDYGYGCMVAIAVMVICLCCSIIINKIFAKDNTE